MTEPSPAQRETVTKRESLRGLPLRAMRALDDRSGGTSPPCARDEVQDDEGDDRDGKDQER